MKFVETTKTHFVFNKFFPESHALYKKTWEIMAVRQVTGGNITRRMTKAADTLRI